MSIPTPVHSGLDLWSATATTTGAATATATRAAGAAGVRHVAKRVTITIGAGAAAQPPVQCSLRDGATILRQWTLTAQSNTVAAGIGGVQKVDEDDLHLPGTAATAMTLQVDANLAANSNISLNLIGYDLGGARPAAIPPYTS
jgi:hypothetical protein